MYPDVKHPIYARLGEDESENSLIEDLQVARKRRGIKDTLPQTIVSVACLTTVFILGGLTEFLVHNYYYRSPNAMLQRINTYSPLLDELPLQFHTATTNGSLFNKPYRIYKDEPSPAVDDAWDEIAKISVFPVSSDAISKVGKDPSRTVRVPEEWGHGTDKHLAELDSQHLIHCLNALRKYSFYSHYYSSKWGADEGKMPPVHKAHRSHCIGALLEHLTCQPSMNIVTFDWVETQHNPFPDFSIQRKCVNWGAIGEWAESVAIQGYEEKQKDMVTPEGAFVRPAGEELLRLGEGV